MPLSLTERAARLNAIEDRMRVLSDELLACGLERSWQYVHISKQELDELLAEQKRLLRRLS